LAAWGAGGDQKIARFSSRLRLNSAFLPPDCRYLPGGGGIGRTPPTFSLGGLSRTPWLSVPELRVADSLRLQLAPAARRIRQTTSEPLRERMITSPCDLILSPRVGGKKGP
jgi:hypothetical protein